jgi:FixJ family two-component response regulator
MSDCRVFLVDDNAGVLKALSRLLSAAGFEVSAFQSADEFLQHHELDVPGCAVLDVGLGTHNGLDLQRNFATASYARPTVFITGNGDVATGVQAMKAGAIDFLVKPVNDDELIAAVSKAIDEDRRIRKELADRVHIEVRLSKLTLREREVLTRVALGRLNKQIAADLGISEKTVKVHRGRAMAKMQIHSVAELVRALRAVEGQLPSPTPPTVSDRPDWT